MLTDVILHAIYFSFKSNLSENVDFLIVILCAKDEK